MKLNEFVGKNVRVTDIDGAVYINTVIQFMPAPDNDPEEDGIGLASGWWLNESDIKEITVIE